MSAAASPFSLDGMDVVVIGGASGIGEASAWLAARSGARVVRSLIGTRPPPGG